MTHPTTRRGRPAKHKTSWPHPSSKYAGRIKLLTGIQPGSRVIYAEFYDEHGKRLPVRERSTGITLRDGPDGEADKADANVRSVEMLGEITTKLAAGVKASRGPVAPPPPPDTKGLFGRIARTVMDRLECQAAEYGVTRPGAYRDRLLGPLAGTLDKHEAAHAAQQALVAAGITDMANPAKGLVYISMYSKINSMLMPHWADVPIIDITFDRLDEWAATLRKQNGKDEKYAEGSLEGADTAFNLVWQEAVVQKLISRDRARPVIDWAKHGYEPDPRSFFSEREMSRLAAYIGARWADADHKTRLHYLYIALMTCSAIRAGLEILSTRIYQINTTDQFDKAVNQDRPVWLIDVAARQGKHKKGRLVTVFQGRKLHFPIVRMLSETVAHLESVSPPDEFERAYLFGPPSLTKTADFGRATTAIFKAAGVLTDPTGKDRVPYCLRHYFATVQVAQGIPLAVLAEWMGTGIKMIEKHYSHFAHASNAWALDGYHDRPVEAA